MLLSLYNQRCGVIAMGLQTIACCHDDKTWGLSSKRWIILLLWHQKGLNCFPFFFFSKTRLRSLCQIDSTCKEEPAIGIHISYPAVLVLWNDYFSVPLTTADFKIRIGSIDVVQISVVFDQDFTLLLERSRNHARYRYFFLCMCSTDVRPLYCELGV